MASFSTSLEQALRRALQYANERSHEYATLEHLLLALVDDRDAAAVMRACAVDLDVLRDKLVDLSRQRAREPGHRHAWRGAADRRLPAGDSSRRRPCAVFRPRGGDGRQRAGGGVRRAREPCCVLPARAEHDAVRRGQLYQPRHRQAGRHVRAARGEGRGRGCCDRRWRRGEEARAGCARGLLHQPQSESARWPHRSLDRART